ncbi:thiopeptide-type bacteriocin biosynthesis protein [Streptomyces sp. NPDC003077]|uniref:thiopeptide-type bacteriocin biosynthesis protein n=1 Tax=Streptomyces sp. NPDC003077 TaxID=3154443 RepID=UPI0033BB540E
MTSLEEAVLAVLAGASLETVAARHALHPAVLADATETYRTAGAAAIDRQTEHEGWHQVRIRFPDRHTAERIAAEHLAPALRRAEDAGLLTTWWFVRKHDWRLRWHPTPGSPRHELRSCIESRLDKLLAQKKITGWWRTLYEPEEHAFGGREAMEAAHRLFHRDSDHVLDYVGQRPGALSAGRCELSVLLCGLLMRAAGQEWNEQGDIWARVSDNRPTATRMLPEPWRANLGPLCRLLTVDVAPYGPLLRPGGSLHFAAGWVTAFEQAGRTLRTLADDGRLSRGLRSVLATHVLFHWNRFGLPETAQARLAATAANVILQADV